MNLKILDKNKKKYLCGKCGKVILKEEHKKNKSFCDHCFEINQFTIRLSEFKENYACLDLLNKPLSYIHCKHIMPNSQNYDSKAKFIFDLATEAYYPNVVWGYYRDNASKETEKEIIDKMIDNNFIRPVRIVITSDGEIWCDNTHTIISYIERGKHFIKDIPFYIVSFLPYTENNPIVDVLSYKNSLSNNFEDINKAIKNASRVEYFIQNLNKNNNKNESIIYNWYIADLLSQF